MTPFAYATPHSNAPYIERPRSGSGIGIYEDEDHSADEAREHEHQGGGSTTEELTGFEEDETGYEERALSDYDSDNVSEEGSVELGMGQHEEWEGVQDSSFHSGERQRAGFGDEEDEDEDDGGTESTPSEYPSTQPQRQVQTEAPLWSGTKAGFRIHVDEGEG